MLIAARIADAMSAKKWKNKNPLEPVGKDNPSVITKWLSGTHNFTIETLVELEYALDVKLLELNELFTPLGLFCKTLYYCVLAKEALLF